MNSTLSEVSRCRSVRKSAGSGTANLRDERKRSPLLFPPLGGSHPQASIQEGDVDLGNGLLGAGGCHAFMLSLDVV